MEFAAKKRLGLIGTAVAVVAGSLTVLNQAEVAESHWIATRSFVRDNLKLQRDERIVQYDSLKQSQHRTELFLAQSERRRIRSAISEKNSLLQDNGSIPPQVRASIQQQITDLQSDLDRVNDALQRLQKNP